MLFENAILDTTSCESGTTVYASGPGWRPTDQGSVIRYVDVDVQGLQFHGNVLPRYTLKGRDSSLSCELIPRASLVEVSRLDFQTQIITRR